MTELTAADSPREVVSFVRRSARMTPGQRRALDDHGARFLVEIPRGSRSTSVAAATPLDLAAVFGRRDAGVEPRALVVEVGPGMGDSLPAMAKDWPAADVLAFEVFEPAVAALIARLVREEVDNVRIVHADAVAGISALLPAGSVDEVWLFFPDPWPKPRHHKRRMVTPAFADLVASRVKPGGRWRLATDSSHYAQQMRRILDGHSHFEAEDPAGGGVSTARPVTRFEQRGIEAGRRIVELSYRRR